MKSCLACILITQALMPLTVSGFCKLFPSLCKNKCCGFGRWAKCSDSCVGDVCVSEADCDGACCNVFHGRCEWCSPAPTIPRARRSATRFSLSTTTTSKATTLSTMQSAKPTTPLRRSAADSSTKTTPSSKTTRSPNTTSSPSVQIPKCHSHEDCNCFRCFCIQRMCKNASVYPLTPRPTRRTIYDEYPPSLKSHSNSLKWIFIFLGCVIFLLALIIFACFQRRRSNHASRACDSQMPGSFSQLSTAQHFPQASWTEIAVPSYNCPTGITLGPSIINHEFPPPYVLYTDPPPPYEAVANRGYMENI